MMFICIWCFGLPSFCAFSGAKALVDDWDTCFTYNLFTKALSITVCHIFCIKTRIFRSGCMEMQQSYKTYRQKYRHSNKKRPTISWYYFKAILPVTQNPEAVRAGNYRDCFVNQAHPWLLLVNSHTHPWNSWKRTLLVWLCWSAYCNYVAFNCALLTPSDRDELRPGTEMSLLFADSRLVGIVCFVTMAHFPSFCSAMITVEK